MKRIRIIASRGTALGAPAEYTRALGARARLAHRRNRRRRSWTAQNRRWAAELARSVA